MTNKATYVIRRNMIPLDIPPPPAPVLPTPPTLLLFAPPVIPEPTADPETEDDEELDSISNSTNNGK